MDQFLDGFVSLRKFNKVLVSIHAAAGLLIQCRVLVAIFDGLVSAAPATYLLTSILFKTDSIDALTYGSVARLENM